MNFNYLSVCEKKKKKEVPLHDKKKDYYILEGHYKPELWINVIYNDHKVAY